MPDKPWDQTLVNFLKRTGEDLKKAGEDIRAEAQKLVDEVRDPETQQKIKDGLGNLGQWAKKSAEDAATKIEEAVRRADEAWRSRGGGGGSASAAPHGGETDFAPKAKKKVAKAAKKVKKAVKKAAKGKGK
ncbi:MAG TPA: transcriptional regulator [Myxococcales bacterium]|nr:transcriptional regulator [Myxococcales bacterium]